MQRVCGTLDQHFCNYTQINFLFVWAVFGGIRLVDQPRVLAAKMLHANFVSFNSPQSANKRLVEARNSRKIRKIESRCEAKGLCHFATWWERQAFADACLASKEAPASKNGTPVKSGTVEMTKAEDGPAEKVWSSLSFEGMTKKNIFSPTEKYLKSMVSRGVPMWWQEQTKEPAQLASPDADKSQPLTEARCENGCWWKTKLLAVSDRFWFWSKTTAFFALWSSSSHVFCLMVLMV